MAKKAFFLLFFCAVALFSSNLKAQEIQYYFVKNYWTKTYLFAGQDFGCGGKTATPEANSWAFEPVGTEKNTYRIMHTDSGYYLNIEKGALVCGLIESGWHSAQWILEPVNGVPNGYRIKNKWKPNLYINNEKAYKTNGVECTTSQAGFHSSYWVLDDGF